MELTELAVKSCFVQQWCPVLSGRLSRRAIFSNIRPPVAALRIGFNIPMLSDSLSLLIRIAAEAIFHEFPFRLFVIVVCVMIYIFRTSEIIAAFLDQQYDAVCGVGIVVH